MNHQAIMCCLNFYSGIYVHVYAFINIYIYFDNIASFYQKYLALNDKYLGFSFLLLQLEVY